MYWESYLEMIQVFIDYRKLINKVAIKTFIGRLQKRRFGSFSGMIAKTKLDICRLSLIFGVSSLSICKPSSDLQQIQTW